MRPSPFILPAQPTPKGESWVHEVKFDGYRVQLHKDGKDIAIYSRNGIDFTSRFPAIAYVLAHLPTKTVIIDAEAVAVTAQGLPNFAALHRRAAKPEDICCYAFDLLRHNSVDTRTLPLLARRAKLAKLVERIDNGCLFLSETFSDGERLLAECEKRGIEGTQGCALSLQQVVDVIVPDGFGHVCNFGPPESTAQAPSITSRYRLDGTQFPGQHIRVRWWKIDETASAASAAPPS